MKNFRILRIVEAYGQQITFATVDVRRGFLWLKTRTEIIFERGAYWYYLETGKYVPYARLMRLIDSHWGKQTLEKTQSSESCKKGGI